MKKALSTFILLLLLMVAVGCSSSGSQSNSSYNDSRETSYQEAEVPDNSRAHPASYGMESFVIRKKNPKRSPSSDMQFFFKNCEPGGDRNYYSRTSYSCDMRDR